MSKIVTRILVKRGPKILLLGEPVAQQSDIQQVDNNNNLIINNNIVLIITNKYPNKHELKIKEIMEYSP